jgi:hypothetical protein
MAIAYIIEIPGMNQEQSAAVLRELGLTNTPPSGQILHIEGPMEGGGTRVVDVWESQEVFDAFIRDRLQPAFERAGVSMPPDLRPTAAWPVTAILK